jgi:large subunit ribosomal protein L25
VGVPEGVRTGGGVLQQSIHEVEVRCLPTQIPSSFELDVAHLGIGDSIHASDIKLPEGVELLIDPEQVICSVTLPKAEAAAAEAAAPAEGEEGAATEEAEPKEE